MTLEARIRMAFPAAARDAGRDGGGTGGEPFTLDVEMTAPAGVTILFGASGAGKTQTLRAVAGLASPDEGRIAVGRTVFYDSALGVNLPVGRRRVGYLFQNLALFPHMTALENVEFGAAAPNRAARRAKALALLERFGVAHAAGRRPRAVSGGEAQRVALARALAGEPRLLLLDEPLSALDEPVKLDIISVLRELNRDLRLPILYVTHSREEALALGERALVFERGRVVARGEPHAVFGSPTRASVARLTGVENVFEGKVISRDEAAGTMLVGLTAGADACRVEVPLGRAEAGSRVTVAVRSGDILLANAEPRGISARNVLAGRVERVERRAEQTLVHVRCGVLWAAGVTHQSIRELGLKDGAHVWLAVKTLSFTVLDAG
ncbi:MAG: ATP-binding cassette domain-containing protein [Pyrinomonadaceae bacterium]